MCFFATKLRCIKSCFSNVTVFSTTAYLYFDLSLVHTFPSGFVQPISTAIPLHQTTFIFSFSLCSANYKTFWSIELFPILNRYRKRRCCSSPIQLYQTWISFVAPVKWRKVRMIAGNTRSCTVSLLWFSLDRSMGLHIPSMRAVKARVRSRPCCWPRLSLALSILVGALGFRPRNSNLWVAAGTVFNWYIHCSNSNPNLASYFGINWTTKLLLTKNHSGTFEPAWGYSFNLSLPC